MPDLQVFVNKVCTAMQICDEYEETYPRTLLWTVFLSVFTKHEDMTNTFNSLSFISYDPTIMATGNGMILLTVFEWQVTVNLFVPFREDTASNLFEEMAAFLNANFSTYSVDLSPLTTHVSVFLPEMEARRFFPKRESVKEATVEGMEIRFRKRALLSKGEVGSVRDLPPLCKPFSRFEEGDGNDTLYWHSFSGRILLFSNDRVPFVPPLPSPSSFMKDKLTIPIFATKFVNAMRPSVEEDSYPSILGGKVPEEMRVLSCLVCVREFGITDSLLSTIGKGWPKTYPKGGEGSPVNEVLKMNSLLSKKKVTWSDMAGKVVSLLQTFSYQKEWGEWMIRSRHIYAIVHKCDSSLLRKLGTRYRPVFVTVAFFLHMRMMEWEREDCEKAKMILESYAPFGGDGVLVHLREALSEKERKAEEEGNKIREERRKKKEKREKEKREGEGMDFCTDWKEEEEKSDEEETHLCLVSRIEEEVFGKEHACSLIGSGVFINTGDVDIVVHVRSELPLKDVYERISLKTGWSPCYDFVSEERVAVLVGDFDGKKVDAQIVREGVQPLSPAERASLRALEWTRMVDREAGKGRREAIRGVHSFLSDTKLKGHRLCLLPGVCGTALAILCSHPILEEKTSSVLERVLSLIEREIPVVTFEAGLVHEERGMPSFPLQVLLSGNNVCERMTACTTRHVCEVLLLMRDVPSHLLSKKADEWRERNMFLVAKVKGKEGKRTESLFLQRSICHLDGHPIVSSVHIEEEGGTLLVRATLSSGDAERYGFKEGDSIEEREGHVLVKRKGRTFRLLKSPSFGRDSVSFSDRRMVCDSILVGEGSVVPNAPLITEDFLSRFDEKEWDFFF